MTGTATTVTRAAREQAAVAQGTLYDPYGGAATSIRAHRGDAGYVAVDRFVEALAGASMGHDELECLFADDVELDATVPQWRFTLKGSEQVRGQLSSWFRDAGRYEELRRTSLPDGELVEFVLTWKEEGVPHAVHQVHVLQVDAVGRIAADRMWCGGRWPASLLAEMAEAAQADER